MLPHVGRFDMESFRPISEDEYRSNLGDRLRIQQFGKVGGLVSVWVNFPENEYGVDYGVISARLESVTNDPETKNASFELEVVGGGVMAFADFNTRSLMVDPFREVRSAFVHCGFVGYPEPSKVKEVVMGRRPDLIVA